ncbi:MAG: Gfo/Idh/MocA family oxidoreductase [Bryobacterales bacterium]|nr:Gfo/Idh/MocA family oxidoreductase [Bryobacterales bacterium]
MTAVQATRVMGANDRIQVGIIGLGGRGQAHLGMYGSIADCAIVSVCDVDQAARERAVASVVKTSQRQPKEYVDMRDMFADRSVDAVSVAAPNHWHALSTIWACQAGKDVYVEKPACHNVYEGQKMVEAARKYKRIVQVGSQGRSMPYKIKAMQLLRDGFIGKVYLAKGLCYKRRLSIGHTPDEPVPLGVDWDKFLGPAPMRPFTRNRFKYNWHWFWDTGNGDIGNQGIHEMDIARWGLGKETLPRSVVSTGGKYVYTDDQETPNTQTAVFDYGDSQIVFEVRGLLTGAEGGITAGGGGSAIGNLFYGADGWMAMDGRGFQVYKGEKNEMVLEEKQNATEARGHIENFFKAVRSRRLEDLTAEVEPAVISASLVHLANASYRTGRKLAVDAAAMRFTGDAEANALLTRQYRAPYLVPSKV